MLFSLPKYMPPVGMRHGFKSILNALLACRGAEEKNINIELFNKQDVIAFDSGKAALLAALQALVQIQSERINVIVPAYTCFSVAAVVEKAGLQMVLCDVLPETLDFDYEMLSTLVNQNTLCIVSTHLFGKSADVDKVKEMANLHGAFTIEDSAQALPNEDDQLSDADVVIYSFGRGKPYSTGGGGLLASYREDIIEMIGRQVTLYAEKSLFTQISVAIKISINDLLISPYIYWLPASLPFLGIGKTIYPENVEIGGMVEIKKMLINNMMLKYPELSESRHVKSQYYHQAFNLSGIPERIIHVGQRHFKPIRYPFYMQKSMNDDHLSEMARLGVVKMYPCGLHRVKRIQSLFVNKQTDFPGADWIAEHLLSLPVHPLVTLQHQAKVVNRIQGLIL